MGNLSYFCSVLEVTPEATIEEIKQAYRDAVSVWHPDRFGENERLRNKATEKLKLINEANEFLCKYHKENGPSSFTASSSDEIIRASHRFRRNGLLGFIDKNGRIAVEPQFEDAGGFVDDFASVKIKGKWGLIDRCGNLVIEPIAESKLIFHHGLAEIKINKKSGFIDLSGTMIIPPIYDSVYDYVGGAANVTLNGRSFFIDKSGKEIVCKSPGTKIIHTDFGEGLVGVDNCSGKGNSCGYMDLLGNVVIETKYDDVGTFNEGLGVVQYFKVLSRLFSTKTVMMCAVINKNGDFILNPFDIEKIFEIRPFSDGIAVISKMGGARALLHIDGDFIDTDFSDIDDFENGIALVEGKGKKGVLFKDGRFFLFNNHDSMYRESEYIVFRCSGKTGVMDRDLNIIFPPIYDSAECLDGLFRLSQNGKDGWFNSDGSLLIVND